MPRITSSMLDRAMHTSEITGIVFAAVLMTHLFNPLLVSTGVVVIAAGCFIGCLMFIKFGDYQDQLEEMKYYGYNI